MKFSFKPSPNYAQPQSTQSIMRDLLIGLLVVFGFSLIFYAINFGVDYSLRALMLLIASVVTAIVTEVVWAKVMKIDIKKQLSTSFPLITAIILVMTVRVDTTIYAIIIATFFAIFFGKLVFGGFGQNIFNPAACGRAIIATSFAAAVVPDMVSSATVTAQLGANTWVATAQTESLLNLFLGTYLGSIGETSFLLIALVGIVLAYRQVIDYRVPVVYIGSLFVFAAIYGLMNGYAMDYALYHIFAGGAIFGAVFMMTDPVTNPTSAAGRIIFALGCAIITIVIRLKANMPEGVFISILFMNMLTPMIEKFLDGKQYKDVKRNIIAIVIIFALGIGATALCSVANNAKDETAAIVVSENIEQL